ncbi:MAG: hypothetical protein EPN30_09200 [Actinomycetota bacterium]|nr:MAG: hypothetical protein EPN30_09200 [Actinomycetota bacterium]
MTHQGRSHGITIRQLQISLGALWIFDGALQLQPYMFQKGSNGFLGPISQNTMGPPNPITDFISYVVRNLVAHQSLATVGIAIVQIGIGVLLIWPKFIKAGLVLSSVWALGVWVVGEGVGQLIFPQASMLVGAPGAGLIYSILGIVLWPRTAPTPNPPDQEDKFSNWIDSGTWAFIIWAVVWCGTALLELESANWKPNAIPTQLQTVASEQPAWFAHIGTWLSRIAAGHGTEIAFALLLIEFIVGWGVLRPLTRSFSLALGIATSLVLWIVGQGVGGILTGKGTDPNLGPAMVIFALALWIWPVQPTHDGVATSNDVSDNSERILTP